MRSSTMISFATATLCALSMAACGDDATGDADGAAAPTAAATAPTTAATAPTTAATGPTTAPTTSTTAPSSAAAGEKTRFGAGCSAVPTDSANPGSFDAMSKVRVATAAAANPLLSTLITAVAKAKLGNTLNTAPALTVFAPTDDAFEKIPAATLNKMLADGKQLKNILTFHVVGGRIAPEDLAGTHKTLQGGTVTVTGSGETFKVDGTSKVICGNVQTANATVYFIDTVLMPKT